MTTGPRDAQGPRGAGGEPTDESLIRRVRGGDDDAFEILFGRCLGAVRGFLRRGIPPSLRRKVSESDLIQETRIVALRRCLEFHVQPDGTFKGWLLRIARHKLRDAIRTYEHTAMRGAAREIERGDRPPTEMFPSTDPTPSQYAIAAEVRARLAQAMEQLPPDYREVLRLTRVEGLSIREAAGRLGRSHEATKRLHSRALHRFSTIYDSIEGGER